MPIINNNLRSRTSLNWSWPLQVKIISKGFELEEEIRNFRSNRDFLQCSTLIPRRSFGNDADILLFPDGLLSLADIGERRIHAGIVFVVEDPDRFPKAFDQWDDLNGIARQFGAAGVFVVPIAKDSLAPWLDRLTWELTGDRNFVETFAKYAPNGVVYFDPEQNWNRPVSRALDHLQERIARLAPNATISFEFQDKDSFSPGDLMEEVARARYNIGDTRELARFSMYLARAVDRAKYQPEPKTRNESRELREGSALESAAMPDLPEAPRFLQAKLYSDAAPEVAIKTHLAPHSPYKANIFIGFAKPGYLQPAEIFPDSIVFEKSALTEEPVQIHFQADGQETQTATLILPRRGDSPAVEFDFLTGGEVPVFECQVIALHRNRVIQWVVIKAVVTGAPAGGTKVHVETVLCTRSALSNLADRRGFGAAFIVDNAGGDAEFTTLKIEEPVPLNTSPGARTLIGNIKSVIEAAAKNIEQYPEDLYDKRNVELLWQLAMDGDTLYHHLTRRQDIIGPLQVIEYRSDFVPVNFVYTFGPPAEGAGLCEHAVQALREGKCRDCFEKPKNPASHICPFGFWGFSKVIEYRRAKAPGGVSDFALQSEPSSGRDVLQVLNNTIHGSAARVESIEKGLRDKIKISIAAVTKDMFPADTWKTWSDLTQAHAPDSIVLLVHTDEDNRHNNRLWIGEDPLIQNYLGDNYIASKKHPMAIVIGCEVADIPDWGFDIGSEFMEKGASVVITNFTKIRGTQAGKIVMALVKLLKEQSATEVRFGEVMLKLKQQLLADGLIVSMSLVTYGDADWKFKS